MDLDEAQSQHYSFQDKTEEINAEKFKPWVMDRVDTAKFIRTMYENPADMFYLLDEEGVTVYSIPQESEGDFTATEDFFRAIADRFKGMKAYLYIASMWSLMVDADSKEAEEYRENPEAVLDNPFKEEQILFLGRGFGQKVDGYQNISRDDKGSEIFVDPVFVYPDDGTTQLEGLAELLDGVLE